MKKHPYRISWKNGKIKVIDCEKCGFIHQWPFPNKQKIRDLYREKYYQKVKPEYIKQAEKRDIDYRQFMARDVLDNLNLIRKTDKPGRVLDIGCSTGIFLSVFKESNWETFGVEPYEKATLLAQKRGIQIVNEEIENVDENKFHNFFNFIYMRQVIDHLLDPKSVIKKIHYMLKSRGFLCIETGNEFNPLQLAYVKKNKKNMWWITNDHINNFTKENLEKLIKDSGFEVKNIESAFPLEFFLFMDIDYRKNKMLGPKIHKWRKNFEMSLYDSGLNDLRRKIYQSFAEMGVGRTIIIFAQKYEAKTVR